MEMLGFLQSHLPLSCYSSFRIDWVQQMAGLSKISDHPQVSSIVIASRRILGRPKVKKDPVTSEMSKSPVELRITDKSLSL